MIDKLFYHGAKRPFNRFSYSHVNSGAGHAQEGAGFYLTTSKQDAAAYGNFILTVKLPANPHLLKQTGKPSRAELLKMIQKAPDVKNELANWGETPRQGIEVFLKGIAHENPHEAYQSVWYSFYRYSSAEFVKNMAEAGYDGVMIKKRDGVYHFMGFNPFKLKIVDVQRKKSE